MSHGNLPNYLRTYRKRVGFDQGEVAFLLGAMSGSKTCRYERRFRLPPLRSCLGLEVIFQTPVRQLFAGVYREVEKEVASRAETLIRFLAKKPQTGVTARKIEALRVIVLVAKNHEGK